MLRGVVEQFLRVGFEQGGALRGLGGVILLHQFHEDGLGLLRLRVVIRRPDGEHRQGQHAGTDQQTVHFQGPQEKNKGYDRSHRSTMNRCVLPVRVPGGENPSGV